MTVSNTDDQEQLRTQALARLRTRRAFLPSEVSPERLLEELQVHQIELELQNEELQRTQDQLRRSHEAYLELFELAPVPFVALDVGHRIRRCNRAARELLGDKAGITQFPSLVPRELRAEVSSWLNNLDASVASRDTRVFRADGVMARMVLRGRTLSPESTVLCIEDVTLAREMEERVAASERDLRRLTDLAPDAVCVCHGGTLAYVNRAFEEMVSTTRDRLHGTRLAAYTHADDRAQLESFLMDAGNAQARPPVRIIAGGGGDRVVEIRTMPFVFAGRPAVLVIARDLTERRRLEARMEQAERLATVGMLVAGVAHEINNPMAFTVGNLEVLVQGVQSGDVPQAELVAAAKDALSGVQRVARIVADLRAFQRVEDALTEVKPNKAVAQALRLADAEVRHRAGLRRDLGTVRPVLANENRLIQVLLNLVVNAAQAQVGRRPDDSWIRVRTWEDGDDVCIAVEDNGPGIAEDQLSRIFDPFFTTRRSEGGTGLGLAICNSLVQHMGGFIEVDSAPNAGARFVIRMPAMDGAPSGAVTTVPPPKKASLPDSLRLLVIDDERAVVRSIQRLLRGTADVTAAHSGNEAVAILQENADFHAVLCDLVMTDGTGAMVAEWLAEHEPELGQRLILMTGMPHPDIPVVTEAPVLQKPFSRDRLEQILSQVLA